MPNPNPSVRAAFILMDTKRLYSFNKFDFEESLRAEMKFGGEGYLAHTEGAESFQATMSGPALVDGSSDGNRILDKIRNRKTVSFDAIVAGKFYRMRGKCIKRGWTTNMETGDLEESFTFEGGRVEIPL